MMSSLCMFSAVRKLIATRVVSIIYRFCVRLEFVCIFHFQPLKDLMRLKKLINNSPSETGTDLPYPSRHQKLPRGVCLPVMQSLLAVLLSAQGACSVDFFVLICKVCTAVYDYCSKFLLYALKLEQFKPVHCIPQFSTRRSQNCLQLMFYAHAHFEWCHSGSVLFLLK